MPVCHRKKRLLFLRVWVAAAGLSVLSMSGAQACDRAQFDAFDAQFSALYAAGKYAESDPVVVEWHSVAETTCGPDHTETAYSLNKQGLLYKAQGRYGEAEPVLLRAIAIYEEQVGADNLRTANSLNNLAVLYRDQGRYAEAEPLYLRALKIREDKLGPDHQDTATSLNDLALFYNDQGRDAEAEPLFLRSLKIYEERLGPDHVWTATSLNNLASLYHKQGRYDEAEPLYLRVLKIDEAQLGPDHPDTATNLNDLALLYSDQGRYAEAEALYERVLKIYETRLGPEHPWTATSVNNLALLYWNQRRDDEAERWYRRALSIREKSLGPDHPDTAASLRNLALMFSDDGRFGEAANLYTRALTNLESLLFGGENGEIEDLVRSNLVRDYILPSVHHLGTVRGAGGDPFPELTSVSFNVWQRLKVSSVASELARAASVLQLDDAELQAAVKALDEAQKEFALFSELLGQQRQAGATADRIAALERQRDAALTKRQQAQAALERTDEDFARFARPEPTPVSTLQNALLEDGEALIAFAQLGPSDGYLAYVVTQTEARFVALSPSGKEVEDLVSSLRQGTALPSGSAFGVDDLADLEFDVQSAHELYRLLFEPLEPYISGIEHLLIVPDGPLESLSFGLLATSLPETGQTTETGGQEPETESEPADALGQAQAMAQDAWAWTQKTFGELQAQFSSNAGVFAGYRDTEWLADRYAISVLPTVGSLEAVRKLERSSGKWPLLGFGDPALEGTGAPAETSGGAEDLLTLGPGRAADITRVRQLTPIPQTGRLLTDLALALKTPAVHLYTGETGTEQDLNLLNERGLLRDYRTIAFATHALIAGELPKLGLEEPALVLTPPAGDSEVLFSNDGLLRASEVVQLNLNADWVLLTACNTAASDGTLGAEPLSGLAKSFFKAGSRSLLVSHWPAEASAASKLVPDLIKRTAAGEPRAEALRQAMISLRNDPDNPHFAHPALWAPFVIVGEGG